MAFVSLAGRRAPIVLTLLPGAAPALPVLAPQGQRILVVCRTPISESMLLRMAPHIVSIRQVISSSLHRLMVFILQRRV